MMVIAGIKGQPVCFLFPDNHVMDESFLEDLNNLLNTGEVPNLFDKKEDFEELKKQLNDEIHRLKI